MTSIFCIEVLRYQKSLVEYRISSSVLLLLKSSVVDPDPPPDRHPDHADPDPIWTKCKDKLVFFLKFQHAVQNTKNYDTYDTDEKMGTM
jgi:hypothetical protein